MEKTAFFLVILAAGLLLSKPAWAAPHEIGTIDEDVGDPSDTVLRISPASCQDCVFFMNGVETSMRRGENMTNPGNPCLVYRCLPTGIVQHDEVSCLTILHCSDNKAPYHLPNQCCATCEYLESLQFFTFNRTSVEPKSDDKAIDSWSPWTEWTRCSRECGGGRHSRMRACLFEKRATINCSGSRVEIRECNTHKCPIDGGWTRWSEWSTCSVSCSNGTQIRSRSCTEPIPMFGGKDCEGYSEEVKSCFLRHCPVDCVWNDWSGWGECSVTCGGGRQFRSRGKQVEKYGGAPCEGSPEQGRDCNTQFCPINGKWTVWSDWSDCSTTCGNGTQLRERSCTAPAPQYGGKDCIGRSRQVQDCFTRHCPVHCEWLEFSVWSPCSATCDGGTTSRIRSFVPALHGGDDCSGDLMEVVPCNVHACPNPCTDKGHPCFSKDVSCKKLSDTEFECGACPRGLRGDARGPEGCQPVDECLETSPCFPGASCENLLEGYQCGACPNGYTGEGIRGYDIHDTFVLQQICEDLNECQRANGGCSELRECENTRGSFLCGACPAGYVEDGKFGCQFSDPCQAGVHDCQEAEYCVNHAVGEYHCYCPHPLIGNGRECSNDTDLDGVADILLTIGCSTEQCLVDNCPIIPNSGQEDTDNDGLGDVCDDDADNDGIKDVDDNCVYVSNPSQKDSDYDSLGNACDNCLFISNVEQTDTDWDGDGDKCDADRDGDGIINNVDNCPSIYNPRQIDRDGDRWGDVCDNCKHLYNRDQNDVDQDGVGDECDNNVDKDKDGTQDDQDNCINLANADQLDTDGDGLGDSCDDDDDQDTVLDSLDNCQLINNSNQRDQNDNGIGDVCEMDSDGDRVVDSKDADPMNRFISRTDFTQHMTIPLTSGSAVRNPKWRVLGNGSDVHQALNSDPSLLVGQDSFSSIEFSGTLYVDTELDDDYVGIVFNYQSNRRFMLVSWKQTAQRYWNSRNSFARSGLQIQMVKSNTGPSQALTNALWKSGNTKRQVRMLYHDPLDKGWEDQKAYLWNIQYSSKSMCMRLRVYDDSGIFVDSGCVCDKQIRGGRPGLYVFSQEKVIFSNLRYKSLDSEGEESLSQCRA